MSTTLTAQIKLRTDTYANWTLYNPILEDKEPAIVTELPDNILLNVPAGATVMKIGDGVTAFNDLNFIFSSISPNAYNPEQLYYDNATLPTRADKGYILTQTTKSIQKIDGSDIEIYDDTNSGNLNVGDTIIFSSDSALAEYSIISTSTTQSESLVKLVLSSPLGDDYPEGTPLQTRISEILSYLQVQSTIDVGSVLQLDANIQYATAGDTEYFEIVDSASWNKVSFLGRVDFDNNTVTVVYILIRSGGVTAATIFPAGSSASLYFDYSTLPFLHLVKDYVAGNNFMYVDAMPIATPFEMAILDINNPDPDDPLDMTYVVDAVNEQTYPINIITVSPSLSSNIQVGSQIQLKNPSLTIASVVPSSGYQTYPIEPNGNQYWFGATPKANYLALHQPELSIDSTTIYKPDIETINCLITKGISATPIVDSNGRYSMEVVGGLASRYGKRVLYSNQIIENQQLANFNSLKMQGLSKSSSKIFDDDSNPTQREICEVYSYSSPAQNTDPLFLASQAPSSFEYTVPNPGYPDQIVKVDLGSSSALPLLRLYIDTGYADLGFPAYDKNLYDATYSMISKNGDVYTFPSGSQVVSTLQGFLILTAGGKPSEMMINADGVPTGISKVYFGLPDLEWGFTLKQVLTVISTGALYSSATIGPFSSILSSAGSMGGSFNYESSTYGADLVMQKIQNINNCTLVVKKNSSGRDVLYGGYSYFYDRDADETIPKVDLEINIDCPTPN